MSGLKQKLLQGMAAFLLESGLLGFLNHWINRARFRLDSKEWWGYPCIRLRRLHKVQILLYHRVNDLQDPYFPGIPSRVFEQQMEFLAEHFRLCSLESALDQLDQNDVPPNLVVVTFDDGYRDNFTQAFPILKKYGVPATIFLTTGAMNDGPCLWFDRVFEAFRETKERALYGYGIPKRDYTLVTQDQKLSALTSVLKFLRSVGEDDKWTWVRILCDRLRVEEKVVCPGLMLRWEDVRLMARNGISFGAHTVHHPILTRVTAQQLREEVVHSKTAIERELGRSVTSFAYPNGAAEDFDESTKQVLREAGYRCAVTTIRGTNDERRDRFELRRGTPWDHDVAMFALRLNYYRFAS